MFKWNRIIWIAALIIFLLLILIFIQPIQFSYQSTSPVNASVGKPSGSGESPPGKEAR